MCWVPLGISEQSKMALFSCALHFGGKEKDGSGGEDVAVNKQTP